MLEVIHGNKPRKQTISIILHDVTVYFRALKTDSACVIVERRCGQLAPRQGNHGSIIEFKTSTEQEGPEKDGQNKARKQWFDRNRG